MSAPSADRTGAPPGDVVPLAQPVLGAAEEAALVDVLRTGLLSLGPKVPEFEAAFAARIGAPHACAVSSGTAALHLAIRAVGVERGDEVVTSPFSFVASANVMLFEGARPVFADIDPVTLNLDPAAAAAAITPRTKALLPVHIFGYPADVPALEAHGLPIVEDACEALGARHADGTQVGGRGHPAAFGFYPNKQMTTGEGGMLTLGRADHKERIDSERNQGRAPDMGWLDHDRLGFNYRLSDVACALGVAQVERLGELLSGRAAVAALYADALRDVEGLELPAGEGAAGERRSWFVYVVKLPHGVDRDAAIESLRARGIDAKPYLPAIHLYGFYREKFGFRKGDFPNAEDAARRCLALPFFPGLSEDEVAQVAAALTDVLAAAPA
jgi:perosamine synthetase